MAGAFGSRHFLSPFFSVALQQRKGLLSVCNSVSLSEEIHEDRGESVGNNEGFPNNSNNEELGTYITSTLAQWTPGLNTFTREILLNGTPEMVFGHLQRNSIYGSTSPTTLEYKT